MERKRDLDPENLADASAVPEPSETEDAEDVSILELELASDPVEEPSAESVETGREVILRCAKLAPRGAGVYRMLNRKGDVLYVGKAKNINKRVLSYTRTGLENRIARMVSATTAMEFVSTSTETEALLLEANLIKRFRPHFNVLLRDDKSFPYILITGGHPAPQITKHRGARNRKGDYFGPFAAVGAVNRTITALERAFLLRSCADSVYESRTRPCLLFQIKRCSGPCTGEIALPDYNVLVEEARDFLSGRSRAVKETLAREMEEASEALNYERAAALRDRLAALSAIQSHHGVHPRSIEQADVFAVHQEGGITCIEVFFIRNFQNWGDRAYYPRADRSFGPSEVLESFLAQFYEDKTAPRCVLLSHDIEERDLLTEALTTRSSHRVEITVPQRGDKRALVDHALVNAREALSRRLAESSTQLRALRGLAEAFGLPQPPRRIEVYDNSHVSGSNPVGVMIVAGAEGFVKNQYRKFNIRSEDLTPGDDYGMMREVLRRRFARLVKDAPRSEDPDSPWPDVVILDGGPGQLSAAREVMADLGISDLCLVAIAKGADRDAGRETFHMPERQPFRMPPRDPVLYFIQRLRDEAHRFAIGAHRTRRKRDIASGGLQEIPGVGPTRKRALLRHFGTLTAIERASLTDLETVPGINAATARAVYDYFHANG
ncbi:MAG TPA: excinuclease ABC subunit UvrC [Xanthobacteraceae bacterium]|nr:excinuclease ABC subunit UvrC [Xanthobacteraceae bacterium]